MEKIELISGFLNTEISDKIFKYLEENIEWHDTLLSENDEPVKIKRKMAYVFHEVVDYKYANLKFKGTVWNNTLSEIKTLIYESTGFEFNSVLLNYYKNGKDEIKWHSDKEKQLGDIEKSVIATINLGATRKFWYLNKSDGTKDYYSVANGDLLMMNPGFQNEYLHAILPEKEIKGPRISLTFRKVIHD